MTAPSYKGIKHVVHISTHVRMGCEHCTFSIGGDDLADSINHYIDKHGYKILHIGSESGENVTMTVAVLGK